MLYGVRTRAQSYETWAKRVSEALSADQKNKKGGPRVCGDRRLRALHTVNDAGLTTVTFIPVDSKGILFRAWPYRVRSAPDLNVSGFIQTYRR